MVSIPGSQFPNLIRTDFWFNDGNIILIAKNAAFKVHKGQLARHSEVFNDLFSLPQPPPSSVEHGKGHAARKEDWDMEKEPDDLIDGCPFVILQDHPSDVFYFLSALYDGLYFTQSNGHSRPHPPSFPALSAVLRLARKYLVEPLVQRCLFHLSLDWPLSLSAWDEREARFTLDPPLGRSSPSSSSSSKNVGGNKRYVPREFCPHPILMIQFALEMNLPEILPAAMYDLSRYGPCKILNGTHSLSTTFDRLVTKLANNASAPDAQKHVRLSRDLLYQILRGREETQRFLASFLENELYSRLPSPSCQNAFSPSPSTILAGATSPTEADPQSTASILPPTPTPPQAPIQTNQCTDSFYSLLLNVLRAVGGISFGRDADALFTLTQATEMLDRTDFYVSGSSLNGSDGAAAADQRTFALNVCQACKQDFREKVKRAREEMWSYLPRWFGLVGSLETDVGVEVQVPRT